MAENGITNAGLLSLPVELITQIISEVAPLGGRKAAHLRLVNRRISRIASPILFASLLFEHPSPDEHDALFSAIFENRLGIREAVTSIRYEVVGATAKRTYELPAVALATLVNLERVSLSATSDDIDVPQVIEKALRQLPRLSKLELFNFSVQARRELFEPPDDNTLMARCTLKRTSNVRHVILNHVKGNGVFASVDEGGFISTPANGVEILEVDFLRGSDIFPLIYACKDTVRHITLKWEGGEGQTGDWLEDNEFFSDSINSMHLQGLASLFDNRHALLHAATASTIKELLDWAGLTLLVLLVLLVSTLAKPVGLLTLPDELIDQIVWYAAPLGGKKAQHLRLTNRRLCTITSPIFFSSITIPKASSDENDDLLSTILGNFLGMRESTTSITYEVCGNLILPALALSTLVNLERVTLSAPDVGYHQTKDIPDVVEKALAQLPCLSTLVIKNMSVKLRDPTTTLPNNTLLGRCSKNVRHLVLHNVRDYGVCFVSEPGNGLGFKMVPNNVEILEVYYLGPGVTHEVYLRIMLLRENVRHAILEWDGGDGNNWSWFEDNERLERAHRHYRGSPDTRRVDRLEQSSGTFPSSYFDFRRSPHPSSSEDAQSENFISLHLPSYRI
ncbi:hypothetical protein P7C70_g8695, partial [Phenoliferia sp. Uapishka_3]